ncbi:MAG: ABC transporter substrate-binding protein, partial [Gammaproteobacteria bacterium]
MRVRTTLQTKTESVDLDYQLQLKNGEWRIYDVIANGVSDLSLKRSNYASLFATGGLETVQREIRDNIRRNATTAQAE